MDIRYGMTRRGYLMRLLALAKLKLEEKKAASEAIMFGIGGALSKDGAKALEDGMEKITEDLDSKIYDSYMMGRYGIKASSSDLRDMREAAKAEATARKKTEGPDPAQLDRDIRKLDSAMSALTGQPHFNPILSGSSKGSNA